MSVHSQSNGSVNGDSTYCASEDSESTLDSTELDHDMTFDVLLTTDNSIHTLTVPASTPLSDLKTRIFSTFKLKPRSYTIEFVGMSSANKSKRKASIAIGKLDFTMVKIVPLTKSTKPAPAPPQPVTTIQEGTVRLIVRLPRLRQSIIRVNPDAVLSTIFATICDKLNLDNEARKLVEFRHPSDHDVRLDLDHTLNHYNLREIYLADKREHAQKKAPAPPGRSKRKAPAPPSPAPNAGLPDVVKHNPPPDVEKDSKKPKPSKRRAAPQPPQTPTKIEEPEPEPIYAQVRKPKKSETKAEGEATEKDNSEAVTADDVTPKDGDQSETAEKAVDSDAIEATVELDEVLEMHDSASNASSHPPSDTETAEATSPIDLPADQHEAPEVAVDDDAGKTTTDIVPDIPASGIKVYDVVDDEIKFDECDKKTSDAIVVDVTKHEEDAPENALPADEKAVLANTDDDIALVHDGATDDDVTQVDDLTAPADVITQVDDVTAPANIQAVDDVVAAAGDVVPVDDMASTNVTPIDVADVHVSATDAVVRDSVDAPGETEDKAIQDSFVETDAPPAPSDIPMPLPETLIITPAVTVDELPDDALPPPPPVSPPVSSLANDNFEPLPPPPEEFSDGLPPPVSSADSDVTSKSTALQNDSHSSSPDNSAKDEFDLRIAESFKIPAVAIGAKKEVKKTSRPSRARSLAEFVQVQNIAKAAEESEQATEEAQSDNDKTIGEIERLHLQIKRMRNRNSLKQKKAEQQKNESWQILKESNRQSWHAGSQSFTIVPNKNKAGSHENYQEAAVPAISLSNSGELKAVVDHHSSKAKEPEAKSDGGGSVSEKKAPVSPPPVAQKPRSALPSYYKKFLGPKAFTATQSSK